MSKLSKDINKLVETLDSNNKKSGVEVPSESGNRTEEMLTIICGSLAGLVYGDTGADDEKLRQSLGKKPLLFEELAKLRPDNIISKLEVLDTINTNIDKIIATIYISFEEDEDYKNIYEGKWISEGDYCVIHRIAVDNTYKGKGIFKNLIKQVEQMCINKNINTIKVDTHEDNLNMQNALKKNGFKYCGVVYVEGGEKRIAFERNF